MMVSGVSICLVSFIFLLLLSGILFVWGMFSLFGFSAVIIEWEIVMVNGVPVVMTILLDWMSLVFMSFVLFISSMVIYYSKEYMSSDNYIDRFIILVLMFVLSMMFLIMSPNLISMLLGWDGLGLVSYCLVIYYQNERSYSAGMITALSNRVGDVGILLGIAWMLNYGSWNYIFYLGNVLGDSEMIIVTTLMVIAAMTSSAQMPFSAWLPAAMAAPTPVSALVHSSTLVTAGVYVLIRFEGAVSSIYMGNVLLFFSSLTMFMAGMGAIFEYDLKKIIALSTLSQLGLMMMVLSMGFPMLAFFHLLSHALFKALLFLCAGAVIHCFGDVQDIRCMGSLVDQMPLTFSCLNTANLALCGVPFLAGFYSSDLILEVSSLSMMNSFIFFLLFFSTGLTASYSIRLSYYLAGNAYMGSCLHSVGDSGSWVMLSGMFGLTLGAIMGGSCMVWLIFPVPVSVNLPPLLSMGALMLVFVGVWGGMLTCPFKLGNSLFLSSGVYFGLAMMGSMWFLPYLSTYGCGKYPLFLSGQYVSYVEQGWSEFIGGQGTFIVLSKSSSLFSEVYNSGFMLYLMFSFIFLSFVLLMVMMV